MGTAMVKEGGRLALACGGCGETVLLLGRDRDWYEAGDDGRPKSFSCGGCGARLTLADRVLGTASRPSPRRPFRVFDPRDPYTPRF